MADRVFPNNINVDMGSRISFSGIDWSLVEDNLKNKKFADDQSDEIKKLLEGLDKTDENVEDIEIGRAHV